MKQFDVPIVHKTYELYRTLHSYQRGITKTQRYTLWQKCENTAITVLEGLIHTGYLPQDRRATQLNRTSVHVDMLRVYLRLALDIKIINQKKFVVLQEQIDEIGRMLGGWIKSLNQKAQKNKSTSS